MTAQSEEIEQTALAHDNCVQLWGVLESRDCDGFSSANENRPFLFVGWKGSSNDAWEWNSVLGILDC